MEQYCIERVDEIPTENVVIEENFQPFAGLVIDRSLYPVLPHILLPIAKYCGCFVMCNTTERGRIEVFVGFKPNIEMAQYTANVVLKQGQDEYRRQYRIHRSIGFGQSFWNGFAIGIEHKFREQKPNTERGIVLYDRAHEYLQQRTGGRTRNFAIDLSRPDMMREGQTAGENVRVWKPVSGSGSGGFLK